MTTVTQRGEIKLQCNVTKNHLCLNNREVSNKTTIKNGLIRIPKCITVAQIQL